MTEMSAIKSSVSGNKKLVLAGGSGFLCQALANHFVGIGRDVVVLTRRPSKVREILWDGETLGDWTGELEEAMAAINLCGRSVDCRYTPSNRKIIMDSRVKPTRLLGEAIAQCERPPRVWLNASSATIYRHTLGEARDESCTDFSATPEARDAFSIEVIRAWERELDIADTPRTRKVALRTTMVLGHWRGTASRTAIHWVVFLSYGAFAATYLTVGLK